MQNKIRNETSSEEQNKEFIIVFQTEPSKAVFEIVIPERANKAIDIENINRINVYDSQGSCVEEGIKMKLFCFCERKYSFILFVFHVILLISWER